MQHLTFSLSLEKVLLFCIYELPRGLDQTEAGGSPTRSREISGVIKQDVMEKPGRLFIICCLLIILAHTTDASMKLLLMVSFPYSI